MFSIILVDDTRRLLDELEENLKKLLINDNVEIRTWAPNKDENDARKTFHDLIDGNTIFVVTDYDLTSQGHTGLFGSSIVGWCQTRAIPVGDYSRGNNNSLPTEPNLFELRVPTDPDESARFIVSVYRGFKWIREQLDANPELLRKGSPSAVLAELLDAPDLVGQLALYSGRFGTSNGALLDKIMHYAPDTIEPSDEERRSLLGYIVGHLLLNSILRFPGPILSARSLTSYAACDDSEIDSLKEIFKDARYFGPFHELDEYFWLSKIDEFIEDNSDDLPDDFEVGSSTKLARAVIERKLGRQLTRHDCKRCGGEQGGFWCPFTRRTVCQQGDCSVGSNSWVPRGARLCRIEREFYDEWAPILGM